eukprot:779402-Pyramimonas_sp.AAC.1
MSWPRQWTGGKMASLFKGKGDNQERNDYLCILLADHSGKSFVCRMKRSIDPVYNEKMPATQFGAVPRRGTDYASHVVQSMIAYAEKRGRSVCILFADLVKAFDRVLRELVFGFP